MRTYKVERLGGRGEVERRNLHLENRKGYISGRVMMTNNPTYCENEPIEQYGGYIHRFPPPAEIEMTTLKLIWRHRQAQQRDKPVCRRSWDTTRACERKERDLTREDRAQDHSTEDQHDRHRVTGLARFVYTSDPPGEREHTVTRDGKDEPGRCDNRHAGVLRRFQDQNNPRASALIQHTSIRPKTAITVMTMLPCLPNARA